MNQLLKLINWTGKKAAHGEAAIHDVGQSHVASIRPQGRLSLLFCVVFGLTSFALMMYYLSNTLVHFTTPQQFPINSFQRFPLSILIFPAEVFSFCFAAYFIYLLISDARQPAPPKKLPRSMGGKVAFLIPVYNEPRGIVDRTVAACKNVRWWRGTEIYLLDDSTKEAHIAAMRSIGKKYGCRVVRRDSRAGYKAGNINNAISSVVREPYFVILDADQAPLPEFLEESMDYFSDPSVGFVQTPQHYVNDSTPLERAARAGTNLFFQTQCRAKAKDGAVPFCGTNAVIRTDVFSAVRGFSYYTATEDVELGLRMNNAGYHGAFVPKILIHGYAPPDFAAYSSQQYRWANGNLAILRENWLNILTGNLSFRQQIHTFFTLGWWLVGIVSLIYIAVPLLSLFFSLGTHHTWLPNTLLVLLYLNVTMGIFLVYMVLQNRTSEKFRLTDALLQYSLIVNSMFIYARAAAGALLKKYVGFVRTDKSGSSSGLGNVMPNIALSGVCFGASIYALFNAAIGTTTEQIRTYLPISVWLLFYSVVLASSMLFVGMRPALAAVPLAVPAPAPSIAARGIGTGDLNAA